ncbi:MAG: hypothetical protein RXO32_06650 [Thermoproteus sp.]
MDAWDVAAAMLGQAPPVAASVALLYVLFTRELQEIKELNERIAERLNRLEWAFQNFGSVPLDVLTAKGVMSAAEMKALAGYLKTPPPARSNYTEEVRRRLIEILTTVEEEKFTPGDVRELQRIAKLIEKEYEETRREDLIAYYYKLQMLIAMLRSTLRAQGKWPLEWDLEEPAISD